ncbi:MAG: SIR2 family protein, partial [Promethearchaeota archaeon]
MIDQKLINEFKKDLKNKKTAFLVGAGISIPAPSYISSLPQENCIKAISDLDSSKVNKLIHAIRPEVFFQVLFNVIGNRALKPLEIINPRFLNSEDILVSPNYIHYFLADRIIKGHIVITTNLDNLIEEAYEKITGGNKLKVILYEEDFYLINRKLNKLKIGILIKFHGSFYDGEGKDSNDTIRLILQQVQTEFPEFKRRLLENLIDNFDIVVMGYSGRDDYDLFSFLLNPPSNRKLWWIKHVEELDPINWNITSTNDLIEKNKILGTLPSLKRTPEDWENLNANSIVLAYSDAKLINVHTTNFLTYLSLVDIPKLTIGSQLKVNEKIQAWLGKWSNGINLIEKNEILASLFETIGGSFLNDAQEYLKKANKLNFSLLEAKKLLNYGRISYKQGNYKDAEIQLKEALGIFKELESILDQADTYQQLVLTYNRLKIVELGRTYGEKAIDLYLQEKKYFEIAQVLRGLALITITSVPDVYIIDSLSEKEKCIELLKEAINFCNMSLKILRKIGNRTGQRGENQTLNVLGLIYLRLGDFDKAKRIFEEYLNLSGRSRFTRESFQGYRNLALALYNLVLINMENKKKYLKKCLECYDHSLICLGVDPTNPRFKPSNIEQFIVHINRNKALLESSNKTDIDFVVEEIKILQDAVPNLFNIKQAWHWKAILLTHLFRVNLYLGNKDEIKDVIERIINEYEQQDDATIEKQPFGIQNAKENLRYIIKKFEKMERDPKLENIYNKLKTLLKRINSLKISIAS